MPALSVSRSLLSSSGHQSIKHDTRALETGKLSGQLNIMIETGTNHDGATGATLPSDSELGHNASDVYKRAANKNLQS